MAESDELGRGLREVGRGIRQAVREAATAGTKSRVNRTGRRNVATAVNVGGRNRTSGAFVSQSGETIERGVMTDGVWHTTTERTSG